MKIVFNNYLFYKIDYGQFNCYWLLKEEDPLSESYLFLYCDKFGDIVTIYDYINYYSLILYLKKNSLILVDFDEYNNIVFKNEQYLEIRRIMSNLWLGIWLKKI